MKLGFKFIGNACGIFIGSEGTKLLCDPWLVDGVFEGSWCHSPAITTKPEDLLDVDGLYISHIHPDHFDERHFIWPRNIPIIVLDMEPNFLLHKLGSLGYTNFIRVHDRETVKCREFNITLFKPFASGLKAYPGNGGDMVDSAMLVECQGVKALNTNDNTLTIDATRWMREQYGQIDLAMLNYNIAGPYPACFSNLSHEEKLAERDKVIARNLDHMVSVCNELDPQRVLPFAGAYTLGGKLQKTHAQYLGIDQIECYEQIRDLIEPGLLLMKENDLLDVETGVTPWHIPFNDERDLSWMRYPYEDDPIPDRGQLSQDIYLASYRMGLRWKDWNISSEFTVVLVTNDKRHTIWNGVGGSKLLECKIDPRLVRRILDRKAHWNSCEIGCHIEFFRRPNEYDIDLHTGLSFFHL